MDKYRIDDSFEMIGAFWKFGQQEQSFTGTFRSRKGLARLLAAPTYSATMDDGGRRAVMQMFNGQRKVERIASICGFTTDTMCALLDCIEVQEGQNADFPTGQHLSAVSYVPTKAVMGFHAESIDAPHIDQGAFYLTKVHQILPTPWKSNLSIESLSYHASRGPTEVFRFTSVDIDAEVICEVFVDDGSKLKKEASMKAIPRIKVIPRTPKSIEWFTKLAFRTENFFTLLLGTSVSIKRVQVIHAGVTGWVVQKMKRRNEKVDRQMWLRCSSQELADTFSRWLSVPLDKQPVELVALGMMRKSNVFAETEFLSFTQALEGFGRMRIDPKKRRDATLKTLIQNTYELLSVEFAKQLVGECSDFSKKVIQTRDYYTHLGNKIGRDAAKDARELFYLNKRLQAFLRCVMLIDLGVSESLLRGPIVYQAGRWRVA